MRVKFTRRRDGQEGGNDQWTLDRTVIADADLPDLMVDYIINGPSGRKFTLDGEVLTYWQSIPRVEPKVRVSVYEVQTESYLEIICYGE